MRGGIKSRGYTIVEVMIFMVISGTMFIMAAAFINGRQGKAEFRQGLNEINDQLRQTINDVNNGLFPWRSNISCTADNLGSSPNFSLLTSGSSSQGENQGCVFMGKVIQFGTQENGDYGYNIYSVAARQYITTAEDATVPTNFADAKPEVIYVATSDTTEYERLGYGMKVINMKNDGSKINAIGLFSSFGSYASSETLASGSQTVTVVPLAIAGGNTSPPATTPSARAAIHNIRSATNSEIDPSPDIVVCFDGGNGQYATLTIGNNGQRLATNVQIYSNVPSGC